MMPKFLTLDYWADDKDSRPTWYELLNEGTLITSGRSLRMIQKDFDKYGYGVDLKDCVMNYRGVVPPWKQRISDRIDEMLNNPSD